jgi:diguanylate cyclase (GGDEF)-like protein/PAS domain S-box-containing protein
MTSPPRSWSRAELEGLVAGRFVQILDVAGNLLDSPDWLLAAAAGSWTYTASEGFLRVSPADQSRLMDWFIACSERPGELVEQRPRFRRDDGWAAMTAYGINLHHQPGIAGLLVAVADEGVTEADDDGHEPVNEGDNCAAHWMLARLDELGHIVEVDGQVHEILGRSPAEVVGRSTMEFSDGDDVADIVALWLAMVANPGLTRAIRRRFVHPDGSELWTECTYLNRYDGDGNGDVLMLAYDITERRAEEAELRRRTEEARRLAIASRLLADEARRSAEELRMLADEVPWAVFACGVDGQVTFSNARWDRLFPGRLLARVHDAVDPRDHAAIDAALAEVVEDGGAADTRVEVLAADGNRMLAVDCRAVVDGESSAQWIVGSVDDITTTTLLRREARHDALTGLLNRRGIEEELASSLVSHPTDTLVVFVDLDGFKDVNDSLGHKVGDSVLREVANRLVNALRPADGVGRYGGDDFVIVCRRVDEVGRLSVTQRLAQAICRPITVAEDVLWHPAASFGVVHAQPDEDVATVLRRADLAMFEDKRQRHTHGVER